MADDSFLSFTSTSNFFAIAANHISTDVTHGELIESVIGRSLGEENHRLA
jgi:hypothetical protein